MGSAIRQLRQVEVEERPVGDERGRHLRPRQGGLHLLGGRGAHDYGPPLLVRQLQRVVLDRVQHQGVVEVELAFEGDLRDPAAGGPEPALPHSSTVSPGCHCSTWALVSAASACGVPVKIGNVPQWYGRQRTLPSSSRATAASFGPIVYQSPIGSTATVGS